MGFRARAGLMFAVTVGLGCGDSARDSDTDTGAQPTSATNTTLTSGGPTSDGGSDTGSGSDDTTAGSDSGSDTGTTDISTSDPSDPTTGSSSDPFTTTQDPSDSDSSTTGFGCGGNKPGCGKVDFLFVIDNSGSMGDNQDNLIASFPGFINTIAQTLDNDDYHIMVVDTDASNPEAALCANWCAKDPMPMWCFPVIDYPCTALPSECDEQIGAGVVYPVGGDASNMMCDFDGGNRYIISSEQNLAASFSCAAKVGDDGDGSERPAESMVAALSFDLNKPGACNEGFLRDDALLVITIITDEPDTHSAGIPDGWFANVVAAKKGDETRVVVLGLITDVDQPNPVCSLEHAPAPKLRYFTEKFTYGTTASVCEPDYSPFFQEAVSVIDTACCEFEPPQ
ncbi:MAG: hypothetical protein R3A51_17015 [Nannocystaceae bacterium]|nr:hypothetical protein [Myxococcales bacterium]